MPNIRSKLALTAVLVLVCAGAALADNLTFIFDPAGTWSGAATQPQGSLIIDFHSINPGTVTMTITSDLNKSTSENLDPQGAIYLNADPNKLSSLVFTPDPLNSNFSPYATIAKSEDGYKADGDGKYDIKLTYGPGTKPFKFGQVQTYIITGAGIEARTFDFKSADAGGNGPFYAAIHVQNTGLDASKSAWVSACIAGTGTDCTIVCPDCKKENVPDGGVTLMLLGGALVGLETLRRRFSA